MTEFYEFHDSTLAGIELRQGQAVLRIDAYRHTWPEGIGVGTGRGSYQPIELTIEDAVVESAFTSAPFCILDGYFKAAEMQAAQEDVVGNELPASLSSSSDVEIRIEGIEESTGEYKVMTIRGMSAAITHKGDARFVEHMQWDGEAST